MVEFKSQRNFNIIQFKNKEGFQIIKFKKNIIFELCILINFYKRIISKLYNFNFLFIN